MRPDDQLVLLVGKPEEVLLLVPYQDYSPEDPVEKAVILFLQRRIHALVEEKTPRPL